MSPREWTTPAQKTFLSSRIPVFQAIRNDSRKSLLVDFWPETNGLFFEVWPNRASELAELAQVALNAPKKTKKGKGKAKVVEEAQEFATHADWYSTRIEVSRIWVDRNMFSDRP